MEPCKKGVIDDIGQLWQYACSDSNFFLAATSIADDGWLSTSPCTTDFSPSVCSSDTSWFPSNTDLRTQDLQQNATILACTRLPVVDDLSWCRKTPHLQLVRNSGQANISAVMGERSEERRDTFRSNPGGHSPYNIVCPFNCLWPGCDKSYQRLQHLNAHIETRGHGFRESLCTGRFRLHRRASKNPNESGAEALAKPLATTHDLQQPTTQDDSIGQSGALQLPFATHSSQQALPSFVHSADNELQHELLVLKRLALLVDSTTSSSNTHPIDWTC